MMQVHDDDADADGEPSPGGQSHSVRMSSTQPDLTAIVVPLLKGVLYRDEDASLWTGLIALQARVRDHMAVLGLELSMDEAEGYAFLRSRVVPEDETEKTPRLIVRRALGFHVSLLLALLRKKLAEFDAGGGETRLILTLDAVVDMVRVFLPAGSNETRLTDQIETHLNKIIELGFVRRLKTQGIGAAPPQLFEVRRILKAFVDAQWLADFDQRMAAYQTQLVSQDAGQADDE